MSAFSQGRSRQASRQAGSRPRKLDACLLGPKKEQKETDSSHFLFAARRVDQGLRPPYPPGAALAFPAEKQGEEGQARTWWSRGRGKGEPRSKRLEGIALDVWRLWSRIDRNWFPKFLFLSLALVALYFFFFFFFFFLLLFIFDLFRQMTGRERREGRVFIPTYSVPPNMIGEEKMDG